MQAKEIAEDRATSSRGAWDIGPLTTRRGRRRGSYRIQPDSSVRVSADGRPVEAVDLSASGSGLLLARDLVEDARLGSLEFELADQTRFVVDLRVVHQRELGRGGVRLGASFVAPGRRQLAGLSKVLLPRFLEESRSLDSLVTCGDSFRTEHPGSIRRLLALRAVKEKRPILVYDGARRLGDLYLLGESIEGRGRSGCLNCSVDRAQSGESSVEELFGRGRVSTFALASKGALQAFCARAELREDGLVSLPLPVQLNHIVHRSSVRSRVEGFSGRLSFEHPRLGCPVGRWLDGVGATGLSFSTVPEIDLLFPGDELPSFRCHVEGRVLEAQAVIRSVFPDSEVEGGYLCGVEILEFGDHDEELEWHRYVLSQLGQLELHSPTVDSRVWKAMESSEYLALWTEDDLPTRLSFGDTWEEIEPDNGHQILLCSDEIPVGTATGNRLYPDTWIYHQLGIDAQVRSGSQAVTFDLLRRLFAGVTYAMSQVGSMQHIVAYMENGRGYGKKIFKKFAETLNQPERMICLDNWVFKGDPWTIDPRSESTRSRLAVGLATEEDLDEIALAIARDKPRLYAQALSLERGTLDLREFAAECAAQDYLRERLVLTCRDEQRMRGAMVVEIGAEGANVFGLLNTCWFVALDDRAVAPEVSAALLEKAKRLFRKRGRRLFLVIADDESHGAALVEHGISLVSPGLLWIAARDVVPVWQAYVDDYFAVASSR